ncbi:hypothetical protein SEEC0006_19546 [Salmonella enterica subsp. enterica serovar Choleraesuis str. 0006]|nr:hypothetical protein SEEC0006_19546 [Salmonella enterica subsp. enterica serovar Choleraesuis str. 0006]
MSGLLYRFSRIYTPVIMVIALLVTLFRR